MNLVFDKRTLQVISVFNEDSFVASEEEILKSLFPKDFKNLSLWKIKRDITHNLVNLSVRLDENKNPDALLYKNGILFECSEEEKKTYEEKIRERKRKIAEKALPRSLLRSIGTDTIRLWVNSYYTKPDIAKSLRDFEYFLDQKTFPISWWGPFTDAGGYANMNREIIFRLHNHHVIPKVEICPTAPQISSMAQYQLSKYISLDLSRSKKHPRIWSFTPIPHPRHDGPNIFFTMMETETLHPEFARICNVHADEVWVPSQHNAKVFESSGVRKPIKVIPLGIDDRLYRKDCSEPLGVIKDHSPFVDLLGKSHTKGINSFRFLSLFGWSYRKGPDILIKSFVKEFEAKDDVALVIVARHSGSPAQDHINIIIQEVLKYANKIRKSNFPQIVLYPHVIPEQQMPSVFRMGHVFIHTSRGEGFSLPQIEASACGLPVISCNNTGMSEYLREDNSFMITNSDKEVCSPEMHWITSYYHGQLFPKLGSNQIEQASNHMRYVIDHYDQACKKGMKLRNEVYSKYTWDNTAKRVADRIKEIYEAK